MQCLFGVYIAYFLLFTYLKCCFAKSSNFGQIRIKRALLYQLSYELVQGRCFQTNTKIVLLARQRAPRCGLAGAGMVLRSVMAFVLFSRVYGNGGTMVISSLYKIGYW